MAKDKTVYTCNECGGSTPSGRESTPLRRVEHLIEGVAEPAGATRNRPRWRRRPEVAVLADIEAAEVPRTPTGIASSTACWGAASSKAAWC